MTNTESRTSGAYGYLELNVGETVHPTAGGGRKAVRLASFDDRSVTCTVNGTHVRIPLGHFADRRLGNPPGDVPQVVEIEGLKIGAEVTRAFMRGTRYSLSFETKPFATHLYLEVMVLKRPRAFTFAYELEPEVLLTPNRTLQPQLEGHAVNPYPYLVEWYLA